MSQRDFDYDRGFTAGKAERETLQLKINALQQRLTAADERADVLSPGSALGDVHLERLRQIDVENRSPVDDDDYSLGQLAYAAAGYAQGSVPAQQIQGCLRPSYWPWHPHWWKPGSPRRMLVKAAALILAEIERIDRAALKPAEGGGSTCNQIREETGLPINRPCKACNGGACIDR
ncbi:hypothetical protein [Pseudomonas lactis]|uniref:hypothetical protein n=1 Tax=Pseudomonas lactis TaxID=1615674 RepID=UPI001A06A5D5|nr:hypothetical protein [Pseudomonas lactis]MBA6043869.1 hypothetical protein [Pseudomonas lactis]